MCDDRQKPYYDEDVNMNDLVSIGDNLANLKAADKSIMIF